MRAFLVGAPTPEGFVQRKENPFSAFPGSALDYELIEFHHTNRVGDYQSFIRCRVRCRGTWIPVCR